MDNASRKDTLDIGEIRFMDNYIPLLEDGNYTIKVEQSLDGSGAYPVNASFSETQDFFVSGPRFQLDPADIQQRYPPPNSQGIFQHDLPHIVLTKRALPWERSIFKNPDGSTDRSMPWMALVLFDTSEILPPVVGTNKYNESENPTGVTTIEVNELRAPEDGVFTGDDHLESFHDPDEELVCQVIDITPETFKAVMPEREDLKYLTHCRQVAMAPKSVPGPDRPGAPLPPSNGATWYSVLVGGRFPSSPPSENLTGGLNVVHLVSLEGFDRYIEKPEELTDFKRIRLISLTSWVFTCLPARGEDFSELMCGLVKGGQKSLKFNLIQQSDSNGDDRDSNGDEKKYATKMLEAGYVPRSYHTRLGEKTFAWYRGPFTPQTVPRLPPGHEPFSSAAQAMVYDQDHGLFDLSYAVAWETGRLLALSDQRFGVLLLNRHRKAHRQIDLYGERIGQYRSQVAQAQNSGPQRFQSLLEGSPVRDSFIRYLVGDFTREIEPAIFKLNDQQPSDARPEHPAPINNYSLLVDCHQEHDAQQLLREIDSEEMEPICEWLAHLYLLYGVPFNNLVAHERLLPPESIRFFYLDRNWLDVLLDGALSIGIQSSRDRVYQNLMQDVITDAVHEHVQTMRDRLLSNDTDTTGNASEGPMAGLLIHSAVVSGWPGLEVRAYHHHDGTGPIGLLRMDRLSADVLLCIFPTIPAWIELNEPKEGLHFGLNVVTGVEEIYLRYVSGDHVGERCGEKVKTDRDDRKLTIKYLLEELQKKRKELNVSENHLFGPADFALQMVKVPQQMIFRTADK